MKIKLNFFLVIIIFNFFTNGFSNIGDKIIAKIGNEIITNYDVINEINTILALSNRPANKNEFKNLQAIAFSSLKKSLIKKSEIIKYKIENYNKADVNNYVTSLERNLKLEGIRLEEHFKKYGANYETFLESVIINLKWNTLIFSLYNKELDIDKELIKSELNKQVAQKNKIEEFNLSEIVLESWDDEKLDKIKKSIKEIGFETTATLYSSSVSSAKGGSIGWVASTSISSSYLSEIQKMNKTDISEPININNNTVIIKLNDKRILKQNNLNLAKIEKDIINKKKKKN